MSSRQLLIGGASGTLISSDPTETKINNAAPVNATVHLYQHPDDSDYYRFIFDDTNNAELACRIVIEGTTEATAKTAYDNLAAELRAIKGKTVAFFAPSGTQRYELPLNFQEQYTLTAEVVQTGRGWRLDCRFIAEGTASDPGSPSGAVTPLTWNLSFRPGGLCTAIGEVTFSSRTTMNTWINLLKSGTHPTWMGSVFKFQGWEPKFDEKAGGYTGSQLHPVTVEMQQVISGFAGNAAMTPLRNWTFQAMMHDRQPSSQGQAARRPNPRTGKHVSVVGSLVFKTQALSSFNSGDSVVTADDKVKAAANKAIDAILQHVGQGAPVDLVEVDRKGGLDHEGSVYSFTVILEMAHPEGDADEIHYIERMKFRYHVNAPVGVRSDGTTKVWPSADGVQVDMDHSVDVRSFKLPVYQLPLMTVPRMWQSRGGETNDPDIEADVLANGRVIYSLKHETFWKRMVRTPSDVIPPPSIKDEALRPLDLM